MPPLIEFHAAGLANWLMETPIGEKMEIHLNISFPRIPCELLTLDIMDVSGEQQTGVKHGINKVQLAPLSQGGHPISLSSLDLHNEADAATHLAPDYCGNCYGAPAPTTATKQGCCQTCEEVREAYASVSWAFGRGENVEQCEREHYSEKLDAQREQGCRIEGGFRVNKVIGNFHIAPGRSFSNGQMHVHDLNNYLESPVAGGHTFTHEIHQLRFGPQLPDGLSRQIGMSDAGWTSHHLNPLDDTSQATDDPAFNYMYFVKVVSTSYLPLGWESKNPLNKLGNQNELPSELIPLGLHGRGEDGSVETHQYSVTSHKRSLGGGDDSSEGHKERLHARYISLPPPPPPPLPLLLHHPLSPSKILILVANRGGIPGIFFSYDISPMKVINRESRPQTFTGFLTSVAAVIGGTLTVAATIDRGLYEGARRAGIGKVHLR